MNVLILGGAGYIGSALCAKGLPYSEWMMAPVDLYWYAEEYIPKGAISASADYSDLHNWYIQQFDVIVLLAGLSSPEQCKLVSPQRVYKENVAKFVGLCSKINWNEQRLIYASSASVYTGMDSKETDSFKPPVNSYDWSKQLLDYTAQLIAPQAFGLRFGTVNGFSPNPRRELLINSMTLSALEEGVVKVNHTENLRAVLWIEDLCRAIHAIIDKPNAKPGLYNLASLNGTIGKFAEAVCGITGAKLEKIPDTGTFSFSVNTSKFQEEFNFRFTHDLEVIVEDCKRNLEVIKKYPSRSFRRNYLPNA